VKKAHRRIEARRSQASLKIDIAEKYRLVNDKKVALDAKTDTSVSSQRLGTFGEGAGRPQRESPSNQAAYPGREKPHSQLKEGSRGPDHPAEDRAYRVEYLESADSIG
jgi:hypothetical protein